MLEIFFSESKSSSNLQKAQTDVLVQYSFMFAQDTLRHHKVSANDISLEVDF